MSRVGILSIELFDTEKHQWAQGAYLVHGYKDVMWTDCLDSALLFLEESVREMEEGEFT